MPLPSSSLYFLPGFLLFSAHVSRAKCWGTDVLISDTLRTGHYEAPSIDREAQKGWWLSQGHIAAQEQTRRSGIQTLNSWQLVPGSPQSENCWIWGWLWLYKRSQKWGQTPLHVRRDLKKKKKRQVGAASSQAPFKSQLSGQVQSQCCHLHARSLLEFQDKGRLWRSGCEINAHIFHRQRNRNQILFFKQEVQMIHSLASGMFISYCSKWIWKETTALSDCRAS